MAKFVFPVTLDQFSKGVEIKDKKGLAGSLSVSSDELVGHLYGLAKHGWVAKQHHKASQENRRARIEEIEELMRKNPQLEAQLKNHDKV